MSEAELTSRLPNPLPFFPEMQTVSAAMQKVVLNGTVPTTTVGLVHLRAGQIVGSTYHTVRAAGELREAGESAERVDTVVSWRDSPYFTDAERAALELTEAVLGPTTLFGERVPDELFERAAKQYDEKALWTLVLAISQICFFIPVGLIARPIPGRPVGQNYSR